jgi:WD40 repeat protein
VLPEQTGALAVCPSTRRLFVAGRKGPILRWSLDSWAALPPIPQRPEREGSLPEIWTCLEGRRLWMRRDVWFDFLDAETGALLRESDVWQQATDVARYVALHPDGRRAFSVRRGGMLVEWDTTSGSDLRQLGQVGHGMQVALDRTGQRLATYGVGPLRLWDVASGEPIASWQADAWVKVCAVRPGGRLLFDDGSGLIIADLVDAPPLWPQT